MELKIRTAFLIALKKKGVKSPLIEELTRYSDESRIQEVDANKFETAELDQLSAIAEESAETDTTATALCRKILSFKKSWRRTSLARIVMKRDKQPASLALFKKLAQFQDIEKA